MATRNTIIRTVLVLVALIAGVEAFARWGLGLGTPPLLVAHPTVDYVFRPNQDVQRFGNRMQFNTLGMRGGPLPTDETGLILVIGDSIIYGGVSLDQSELAVTQVTEADPSAYYANISAGSWGPGNQRAYLAAFGPFDATAAILVVNPQDAGDVAEFAPLNPRRFPTEPPFSALAEAITRYLPDYIPQPIEGWLFANRDGPPRTSGPPQNTPAEDFSAMLADFGEAGVPSCVVLHPFVHELVQGEDPDRTLFRSLAAALSVPVVDLLPALKAEGGAARLYSDALHLNAVGQVILAEALLTCRARAKVPITPDAPATTPTTPR